jgi:hypothetical protein
MDRLDICIPFEPPRVPFAYQTDQAQASDAISVAQGKNMRELVGHDRTSALGRRLALKKIWVDVDEISHRHKKQEARQTEAGPKVVGLAAKYPDAKVDVG